MLPTYMLAVALAGQAESSNSSRFAWPAPAEMLRNAGLSLFNPQRTRGLDLTPLAIPQRIEFPPASEIIAKHMDIDSRINAYEEIIVWLKEDAPEETDQIKRFEKRLAEVKEMKKNKETEDGKSRTGEPATPRRKD